VLPCYVLVPERVPAGVAATENRTNSDVTIVRCTNIDPIVSCRNACRLRIINWQVAEDNGVVIHTPLALTHSFLPRRPAYPEAWRQYLFFFDQPTGQTRGWIFTRDSSKDVKSRKDVLFGGYKT